MLQKNVSFLRYDKGELEVGQSRRKRRGTRERVCKLAPGARFYYGISLTNTILISSEAGTNVSGGQKQRLLHSEGVAQKPKILILRRLDERS